MRNRGSVVLIQDNKVGLIRRERGGSLYYVFPGGGIEPGETPEAAAKREAFEEVGVAVEIERCLAKVEFNGTQYFFQASILSGEFGEGQGEEYTDSKRNGGTYLPVWADLNDLAALDVKPREVARMLEKNKFLRGF